MVRDILVTDHTTGGGFAMLEAGTRAPDFSLQDQNGETRSLHDFLGQKVILYFYSKDMTSG